MITDVYRYLIIDLLSCLVAQVSASLSLLFALVPVSIKLLTMIQAFYVDRAYRLHGHWWPLLVLGLPV